MPRFGWAVILAEAAVLVWFVVSEWRGLGRFVRRIGDDPAPTAAAALAVAAVALVGWSLVRALGWGAGRPSRRRTAARQEERSLLGLLHLQATLYEPKMQALAETAAMLNLAKAMPSEVVRLRFDPPALFTTEARRTTVLGPEVSAAVAYVGTMMVETLLFIAAVERGDAVAGNGDATAAPFRTLQDRFAAIAGTLAACARDLDERIRDLDAAPV